ncbi:uncharacterized protein KY384_005426 [Bacidia gigantensis]|uniref:uncharacterized protein n=1 Tax=Bacidia gigantensis TaxID=2732470 RepID=UPI001D04B0D4|nr:uncharacterized protein KY384_005426 [Bacidia gigantensis]KAG8529945.1 hypothetical protein KY384_005426 [Bacidia gigantensis]
MPLPTDEKLLKTSQDLVNQLHTAFGKHAGYRATHAKGLLLNGTFTPSAHAQALSIAPHLNNPSTSITVRFSSSTGIPQLPDADPNGEPRGIAIRFNLGEHSHTDIIAHSTPHFPVRTGAEFLELLRAIGASPPGTPSPSPIETFLGSHPAALAFVSAPKPIKGSFAFESYYGLSAIKFINNEGKETYLRYRVLPESEGEALDDAALKVADVNFLHEEIRKRATEQTISFKIVGQVAQERDGTDDVTVQWPEDRKLVELGTVRIDSLEKDDAKLQKHIIFDPIPNVKGIEPSKDPLFDLRAAVYLISGRERRAA